MYLSVPPFLKEYGYLIAIFSVLVIIWLANGFGLGKVFADHNYGAWRAFVPFLDMYTLCEIETGTGLYFLLEYVPIVGGIIIFKNVWYKLVCEYGYGLPFMIGMCLCEPLFLLILAYGNNRI